MPTKLAVIVGITGIQGGSVATQLLKNPSYKIRGLTRDPSKSAAQSWTDRGVELVRGDLDDVDSLRAAFAGASFIFGVTDFFETLQREEYQLKAQQEGVDIKVIASALEEQRGKNIAIAAAAVPELEHYVWSTLSAASVLSKGKYTHMYHFDSKARVDKYIREAPEMAELSRKSSFVQLGYYLDNWKFLSVFLKVAMKDEVSGGYYHANVGDGDRKVPFLEPKKDTGIIVEAILNTDPGKTWRGYSQMASWKEYMAIWTKTLGVELHNEGYKALTWDDVFNTVPIESMKVFFADTLCYIAEFGHDGTNSGVIPIEELGIASKLSSIKDYIESEDWSSAL
ncbi:hypothetical protein FQN52_006659 [Onygenales sp. PD_12]|nr:hypothetical protein FQN53_001542 [Emmonsiellopsis sp. PD_33]KAK2788546.1 hypothetical protein FQN52_006659 [Onygenales sp. PD_12]